MVQATGWTFRELDEQDRYDLVAHETVLRMKAEMQEERRGSGSH